MKDLTKLAKDIAKVFEQHGFTNPALAVAFTVEEDYREVHWVTNVSRGDGIALFMETAQKMQAKAN